MSFFEPRTNRRLLVAHLAVRHGSAPCSTSSYCDASNFLLARSEWERQRKSSFRSAIAHPVGVGRGKGSRRNSLIFPCRFPGRSTEASVYAGFVTSIFSTGKNSLIDSLGREFTSHELWRALCHSERNEESLRTSKQLFLQPVYGCDALAAASFTGCFSKKVFTNMMVA